MSIRDVGTAEPFGRFIPPCQMNTDNFASSSSEDSQQFNETTVFNGQKATCTVQPRNTGMQMSISEPAPTGITGVMQTSPKKVSQTGGTQTTPPSSPKRSTSTGGTQTTPPGNKVQDQGVQGQLDHNHIREDLPTHNTASNIGKGKKNRKKSTYEVPPWPGTSSGGFVVPRTDFHSRNLGTGRPTIQCAACGEYSHWRRECPYDNYCTTCNNHDHATHMCRAPKQTPQQSPAICVYWGSTEHSSSQCHNRPWDKREQPCSTLEA